MTESTCSTSNQVSPGADDRSPRAALAAALRRPRYEVLSLAGTLDQVQQHVPRGFPVTVASTPRRGMEPTLALVESLSRSGFEAVPHLAARLVADEGQLVEILHRLDDAGIRDVFVIAGDGRPVGDYADSLGLLSAMRRLTQAGLAPVIGRIGIAGYPEGHPAIGAADLTQAPVAKQPMTNYIVSQMCFDAETISAWASGVRRTDVRLPIHVGIPGMVDHRRLLRIVRRIGVGPSARFLRKHRFGLVRLARPGGYRPDRLLGGLAPDLSDPDRGVVGLHVYTLGDVAATERWRRATIDRLTGVEAGHA